MMNRVLEIINDAFNYLFDLVMSLPRFLDWVLTRITRLVYTGLVLYVAIRFFYPEFAEEFPTLYSIFHGCGQLLEFIVNWLIRATQSLLNGVWRNDAGELLGEWVELWNQFTSWFMAL